MYIYVHIHIYVYVWMKYVHIYVYVCMDEENKTKRMLYNGNADLTFCSWFCSLSIKPLRFTQAVHIKSSFLFYCLVAVSGMHGL